MNEITKLEAFPAIFRAYKRRHKALQRRLSAEQAENKRLRLLLGIAVDRVQDGAVKELIKHELRRY